MWVREICKRIGISTHPPHDRNLDRMERHHSVRMALSSPLGFTLDRPSFLGFLVAVSPFGINSILLSSHSCAS